MRHAATAQRSAYASRQTIGSRTNTAHVKCHWTPLAMCLLLAGCSSAAPGPGSSAADGLVTPNADIERIADGDKAASTEDTAGAASPTPDSPFALFSGDSNLVLSMDLSAIAASPLYEALLRDSLEARMGKRFTRLREHCAIEPFRDTKRMISAQVMTADFTSIENEQMVFVQGTSRARLRTCLAILLQRGEIATYAEHGAYGQITNAAGDDWWHLWLSHDTMVFGSDMSEASLRSRAQARAEDSLQSNVSMLDLMSDVQRQATVWGVMELPIGLRVSQQLKFHAVYGEIYLGQTLDLRIGLRHAKPADAHEATVTMSKELDQLQAQMGTLAKFAENLEISTHGNDTMITLSYNQREMEAFIDELAPLIKGALAP